MNYSIYSIVASNIPVDVGTVRISDPDTVKSRQQQSLTNLSLSTLPDVVAFEYKHTHKGKTVGNCGCKCHVGFSPLRDGIYLFETSFLPHVAKDN